MIFVIISGYFYPIASSLDSLHKLNSLPFARPILLSFSPIVAIAFVEESFLGGPPILTYYQLISISDDLLGS